MKITDFLPIGSVVRLHEAKRQIMIIGCMQVKHFADGRAVLFDYAGVPYPEGYVGNKSAMLFNHDKIEEVIFKGYSSAEREKLMSMLQEIMNKTDEIIAERSTEDSNILA